MNYSKEYPCFIQTYYELKTEKGVLMNETFPKNLF